MELVFCVDGLRSIQKILAELVAQVNVDFFETALIIAKSGEVLIDVLPLFIKLI